MFHDRPSLAFHMDELRLQVYNSSCKLLGEQVGGFTAKIQAHCKRTVRVKAHDTYGGPSVKVCMYCRSTYM